jgi:thiamine-monophosphate kinase
MRTCSQMLLSFIIAVDAPQSIVSKCSTFTTSTLRAIHIVMNENDLISYLRHEFPSKNNILGIGDDCAVVDMDKQKAFLVTTDALVEGVHFLKEQIPAVEAGYKTVAVNVSDICAMGGIPKYAFLSMAIPKSLEKEWLVQMIAGVKNACEKWDVLLLGGDTVGSKRDVFLNLTLIGEAKREHIKYRHTAKAGDFICVDGFLGDSGAGFKLLQIGAKLPNQLIHSHFHPEPNPQEAAWMASHHQVHAMMDVSDGLNCDLKKLIQASHCGAVVELTDLPLSEELLGISHDNGWNALEIALMGGEDYRLLFTVSPEGFRNLQKGYEKRYGKKIYKIGDITDQKDQLFYYKNGKHTNIKLIDFAHF